MLRLFDDLFASKTEGIEESRPEFRPMDVVENGELESNHVNENGLEAIDEQGHGGSPSARSAASRLTNGSVNEDEKPELSDVFEMVCIQLN